LVEAQEIVDLERTRLQATSKEWRGNMVRMPTILEINVNHGRID